MPDLALKAAQKNSELFYELKLAQSHLEQARNDYELGVITRAEYISITEECIRVIRTCSQSYKKS